MKIEFTEEPIVHVWLKNFGAKEEVWEQLVEDFESVLDTDGEGIGHLTQVVQFSLNNPEDDWVGSDWDELILPGKEITAVMRRHPLKPGHQAVMMRNVKGDFANLALPGYVYLGCFPATIDENYEPDDEY
jgi:hypothetical protein